ncbi:hypothetical protein GALL_455100 [mine drainage metagenome]|uniref:Uncharacterized protein n=1 Tax=mine drainage metagenome TaxID=410659 RepID=A0A1J5Q5X4_9ZZZZ
MRLRAALRVLHRLDEGLQPLDRGAPVGNRSIRTDEPRQCALHLAEGLCRLGQSTELDLPGEIARSSHQNGEDDGELAVERAVPGEQLLPLHDAPPVAPDVGEAVAVAGEFAPLAAIEGDAFVMLASARQAEAEIRLVTLLVEVEPDQRLAHPVREHAAQAGIKDRHPHHVAGDGDPEQGDRPGQHPQHEQEGKQCHQRRDEAEEQVQAAIDEAANVFRDPLVGVVGVALSQRHAVVRAAGQPVLEKHLGHPAPPTDLQHLQEILRIHRQRDIEEGVAGEHQQQVLEGGEILRLQRVEEVAVPLRQLDVDPHQRQVHRQHEQQQPPAPFLFLRHQIGPGKGQKVPEGETVGLGLHGTNGSCRAKDADALCMRGHSRCHGTDLPR